MKRRMGVTAAVLAGVAGVAIAAGVAGPGTAAAGTVPSWTRMFESPTSGAFLSIAAISKTNVWTVGEHYQGSQTVYKPFVEHFNGNDWKPVKFPNVAMTTDRVQATSATNVWVFGYGKNPQSVAQSVVYRWDGKQWHRVPVPANTSMQGSVVLGPKNVWAFGGSWTLGDVFHWNGSTWQGYDIHFMPEGIAASSASNVWMAGETRATKTITTAKAYRWNGTRWLGVSTPHPVADLGLGLTVLSPSNVWLGWASSTKTNGVKTQAAHWNGQKWTTITAPSTLIADSTQIVPDARGGYWFGPFADWTGKAWIDTEPAPPQYTPLGSLVRVPGTSSFLAGASVWDAGSATQHPAIYRLTVG